MRTFKKEISITGKNGTITGRVIVTINIYTVINESSDNPKLKATHSIDKIIDRHTELCEFIEFDSQEKLYEESKRIIGLLMEECYFLANKEAATEFERKMEKLFNA